MIQRPKIWESFNNLKKTTLFLVWWNVNLENRCKRITSLVEPTNRKRKVISFQYKHNNRIDRNRSETKCR